MNEIMNLTDYPTPRTDPYAGVWATDWPNGETIFIKAQQIEREAAAWRAVAEKYRRHFFESDIRIANEAFDALKSQLTQP